jgi:hypothetical protein
MGGRIYDRFRTQQRPQTKFACGTPNGMKFFLLLMTVLIVFKVAGLSVRIFQTLVHHETQLTYGPIVRFGLPSYSAISF